MVRTTTAKHAAATRDLRHRVLTCITKLSDRDTHSQALSDLHSVIPTLTADTFSLFITSLSSTSSSDRSFARSASLRLLSSLSSAHGAALSNHLPKLVSAVVRRLRDPDSAVRSAAASTAASFAANIVTASSSFSAILRPLCDALATEQDVAAQSAAAICISAAVDTSPEIDTQQIVKMLPKWMKLLKCEGFKAKSAVLVLIRSVIRVCEVESSNLVRELVVCVAEFLKCDDWTARKSAAEVLTEIGTVQRDSLSDVKVACLKTFEARKFDKVKAVREAMIRMVEVWKEIPDVVDDGSPPPSQDSSKEHASDGRYPARSKISSVDSNTPKSRTRHVPLTRSSPSDTALKTTAGNRAALGSTRKKPGPSVVLKLDTRKPSSGNGSSVTPPHEDNQTRDDEEFQRKANVRPLKPNNTRRSLFCKDAVSQVVPYSEENDGADVVGLNGSINDSCRHQKDCEELSSIRKQLLQIENQQSNLMELLQKYIGSSQDGMRTLETRVHGLEMALDDISYDLALSTTQMSTAASSRASCCLLHGFSSRFWRKSEGHCSTSRFSFSGSTPPVSAMRCLAEKSPIGNTFKLENNSRFRRQGMGGVIVNPLAEIQGDSRRSVAPPPSSSSSRALRNGRNFT